MGMIKRWVLLALISSSCLSWALTSKEKQTLAMEVILTELETHYGMTIYKAEQYNVTLPGLRKKYGRLIHEAKTLEEEVGLDKAQPREILPPAEFRQLMIGMISELRDGHVNISGQSKNMSTLGLIAAGIGEKLYVTEVRKDLIAPEASM